MAPSKLKRSAPNVAPAHPAKKAKVPEVEFGMVDDMIDEAEEDDSDSSQSGTDDSEEEDEGDYIEGEDLEQDAEEDEQDDFMASAELAAGKKVSAQGSALYKAPTTEEIQGLQESSELFKSNIFKLQIDELLKEVHVDYKKTKPLETALHKLKEIFDKTPATKELSLSDIKTKMNKENIVIPFPKPEPASDIQYTFGYSTPAAMHLVGSFPLKSVVKSRESWSVDVAVEMPEHLFQEKDHMNHRYFYKRSYYLTVLAAAIKKKNSGMSSTKLTFSTLNGDQRKPILILAPSGDKSETDFSKMKCMIRIIPYIPASVFPVQRLSPSRNNVRSTDFQEHSQPATPQYNTAIQHDTAFTTHLKFLYQHSKTCPAFADAAVLLKVWANQRGLIRKTGDGFNGFILTMLLGYLLQGGGSNGGKKLANGFSSYQLVKGVIDYLAQHDFTAHPVFMGTATEHASEFSKDDFVQNFDVVIVDPSGMINLAGHVSKACLHEVQHEARLAMKFFTESSDDKFEALFLKRVDSPLLKYDNVIQIRVPPSVDSVKSFTKRAALDYPIPLIHFVKSVTSLLAQGLGGRAELVTCKFDALAPWSISASAPTYGANSVLTIGLLLKHPESSQLVVLGPAADNLEEAKVFRALWGNKAELRRFKDGSITESVVWEAKGTDARHLIVGQMVAYLLKHHFSVPQESVKYWAGQLNKFINYHKNVPERLFDNEAAAATGFQSVVSAFESLSKAVKQAENMPLSVTHMYFTSAAARLASTFIPQPRDFNVPATIFPDSAQFVEPLDVVIQFESSTKWPDNLKAIQRMKTAFYLRIAEKIKYKGMRVTVVEEKAEETLALNGYMDVVVAPGYVFRCRISHDKEIIICETALTDRKASQASKDQHAYALNLYHKYFTQSPMHTFQIHALAHRHTSLSQTIRLTKRWISAHWLSPFFNDETVELLAASVFVDAAPWAAPGSGITGFTRVLNLLSTWDWKHDPLIVDLNGEMTGAQRDQCRQNFVNLRASTTAEGHSNHAAMFIGTGADTESKWWTWEFPSKMILARTKSLATASLAHLTEAATTSSSVAVTAPLSLKPLFITPTADYDFLVELDSNLCTRYAQNLSPDATMFVTKGDKYKNLGSLQKSAFGEHIMVGFDPVAEYVAELQKAYGDIALFFHDKHGGTCIGALWNPVALQPKTWKVNVAYNSKPADMEDSGSMKTVAQAKAKKVPKAPAAMLVPNIEALLAEIERVGHGLVKGIKVNKVFTFV